MVKASLLRMKKSFLMHLKHSHFDLFVYILTYYLIIQFINEIPQHPFEKLSLPLRRQYPRALEFPLEMTTMRYNANGGAPLVLSSHFLSIS